MKDYSKIVSRNLSSLRKARGITQGQLAEKFAYSDKSISKWETGEGLPDLNILAELASFYGVSLDYLIKDHSDETLFNDGRKDPKDIQRNKTIVVLLAVVFVWTIAAVIYSSLRIANITNWAPWLSFIWAIPLSFLVTLHFAKKWGKPLQGLIGLICLYWTFALALYVELGMDVPIGWNLWFIGLIPIPSTIGTIFFFRSSVEEFDAPSL